MQLPQAIIGGKPRSSFWLVCFLLVSLLLSACGDNNSTTQITPQPSSQSSTGAIPSTTPTGNSGITATSGIATTGSGPTSALTTAAPSSSATPPPGAVKGADGRFYYIVDPILPFYKANPWLGLPLGGMKSARPDGYDWDGVFQDFQRGRVEAHLGADGKYTLTLGLVNQELLKLKGQVR